MRASRGLLAVLPFVFIGGCATVEEEPDEPPPRRRAGPYDELRKVPVAPLDCSLNLPMVARKEPRPVYVLASASDIKKVIPVHDGPTSKKISNLAVVGMRKALTEQIARGFDHYFKDVYVVESERDLPRGGHIEVRVQVRRVWTTPAARSAWGIGFGWRAGMDWAISVRLPPQADYLYSLSDRVEGNPEDDEPKRMYELLQAALDRFFQRYVNRGVHEAILRGTPIRPEPDRDDRDDGGGGERTTRPRPRESEI